MVATEKMEPPVNLVHLVMLSREIKESPEHPVYLVRLEIRVPRVPKEKLAKMGILVLMANLVILERKVLMVKLDLKAQMDL